MTWLQGRPSGTPTRKRRRPRTTLRSDPRARQRRRLSVRKGCGGSRKCRREKRSRKPGTSRKSSSARQKGKKKRLLQEPRWHMRRNRIGNDSRRRGRPTERFLKRPLGKQARGAGREQGCPRSTHHNNLQALRTWRTRRNELTLPHGCTSHTRRPSCMLPPQPELSCNSTTRVGITSRTSTTQSWPPQG